MMSMTSSLVIRTHEKRKNRDGYNSHAESKKAAMHVWIRLRIEREVHFRIRIIGIEIHLISFTLPRDIDQIAPRDS